MTTKRRLSLHLEEWPFRTPFTITGWTFESIRFLVAEISQDGVTGHGEAAGVYYLEDTPETAIDQAEALRSAIESGAGRDDLQNLLPPGGARNALDCALWDLECKLAGTSIWQKAGVGCNTLTTAATVGIKDTAEEMADWAISLAGFPLIKVKLNGDRPVERMTAIRKARPDATLIVDANQGFTLDQLVDILPALEALDVKMVEQPLPRGGDEGLEEIDPVIPLCADESCLHRGELDAAARRYQVINIKLDKTGGLTEALALAEEARARGLGLMVGNMVGTSLAMAPAFVIAQLCRFVDLDGPLALRSNRSGGLVYDGSRIGPGPSAAWG
jgi:L-alanine-DL-glutamate epimerase-like enolase superfamily enzyme